VADRNQVGGRDERASGRPYGASIGSGSSDAGRSETGVRGGELVGRAVRPEVGGLTWG